MTIFEKDAPDIDLLAVVAIDEDVKRHDVDSVTVMDKDTIQKMFRKNQK